ncbi:MAG: hypothetical protein ABFS30_11840, partial [Pseudomonadota bacterium]
IGLSLVVIGAGAAFMASTAYLFPEVEHEGIFWTLGSGWAAGFSVRGDGLASTRRPPAAG